MYYYISLRLITCAKHCLSERDLSCRLGLKFLRETLASYCMLTVCIEVDIPKAGNDQFYSLY